MKDKLSHLVEHWERHYLYGGAMEYMQCANELRATLDADGDSGAMAVQSARERVEMALREPNSAKAAQVASELGAAHRAANPPAQPTKLEDARGEAVAWCCLNQSGKISYFDGKPMIMVGKVGNQLHETPLYTAPQPSVDLAAIREVIAELHKYRRDGLHELADKLTAAIQENAK